MQATSLGLVTSAASVPLLSDKNVRCAKIMFRARNANTGIVNIGVVGFTAGGAGMIAEILKPASGYSDELVIGEDGGDNIYYPADYAVAPAVGGEGVYVSYWTR